MPGATRSNGPAMLKGRALLVDGVLQELWTALGMPAGCRTGGSRRLRTRRALSCLRRRPADPRAGRTAARHDPDTTQQLEQLVGLLWDIGLDIGHSVRSVSQCLDEAARDITVQTSLLEARYLAGSANAL